MVQQPNLLGIHRRITILIGVSDIVLAIISLIVVVAHMINPSSNNVSSNVSASNVNTSTNNSDNVIINNHVNSNDILNGLMKSTWAMVFFFFVLAFVFGFGIILAWGAIKKNTRLLMSWIIPNVITLCHGLLLIFIGAFYANQKNYELLLYGGIGFLLVRSVSVLKVYEMYVSVQAMKKSENDVSVQLYKEMETEEREE